MTKSLFTMAILTRYPHHSRLGYLVGVFDAVGAQMNRQYLHLSAYFCDKCAGPVVAGWLAVRENEISKETDIRQVGAICLSCGHRESDGSGAGVTHNFPPVEWEPRKPIAATPVLDAATPLSDVAMVGRSL